MEYRSNQRGQGTGEWHTVYYLYDGQGNVRQLTNERGQVIARYSYDPFGVMMNRGEQDMGMDWGREEELRNTITYQGREYDRDSGLYYYRARYQDPRLGRFIEVDPLLREVPTYTANTSLPASSSSGCGCGGGTTQINYNTSNFVSSTTPNIIFTPAYIFVNNDPVNLTDPSGLLSIGDIQIPLPIDILKWIKNIELINNTVKCVNALNTAADNCIHPPPPPANLDKVLSWYKEFQQYEKNCLQHLIQAIDVCKNVCH